MKICMLAPEFIPAWGGVGTYIVELLKHLPTNVDVHVLAPMRKGFGDQGASNCSSYAISGFLKSNIHIHFICMAKDTFYYNGRFQYECFKQIPKIIKEERIDLIHSHTAHMPDLLLMFRRIKIPIVTTVHSTIKYQRMATKISQRKFDYLERSEKATYLAYPFLRLCEELYFRRKRSYITPSNWMKRWLEDNYNLSSSISIIPNSVDVSGYGNVDSVQAELELVMEGIADKRIVLFVGRLLSMKGVDVLLKAIPRILERVGKDRLLFVFVGPGDQAHYLKMAKLMGIQSSCLFTGALSRESVFQLMKASEILVAPSFIENAPYTLLEAMACGLPVIATNVGGVSEIIQNGYNGYLFEPNSYREIENLLPDLLSNESLKNYISQNARETIRTKFSWDVNLKKYLDVYSNIISGKQSNSY